jgi:hypothetical protein
VAPTHPPLRFLIEKKKSWMQNIEMLGALICDSFLFIVWQDIIILNKRFL